MPWFRNHYVCTVCEGHWLAEATEAQDANCPHCRAFDVVPYRSDDLTRVKVSAPAVKVRVKVKARAA
jgi:DNA-directed RNA polymerase subunit RPC12/RpoP